MKRYFCVLIAVLLACMPLAALAEGQADQSVVEAFSGTWVSLTNEGYAAEIWDVEGEFICQGTLFINEDEDCSWVFESCVYDPGANALICEGGELVHEVYDEASGDMQTLETVTGFGAKLTVDDNGRLRWEGSGDAIPDQIFASLEEVGEPEDAEFPDDDGDADPGDAYIGDWICERASIYIDEDDGVYTVNILWGSSAWEEAVWEYACRLDAETGALTGTGKMSIETYDDGGELVSTQEVYDGGAATFTIDGDELIWDDAREHAGEGMRFVRNEPEGDSDMG